MSFIYSHSGILKVEYILYLGFLVSRMETPLRTCASIKYDLDLIGSCSPFIKSY